MPTRWFSFLILFPILVLLAGCDRAQRVEPATAAPPTPSPTATASPTATRTATPSPTATASPTPSSSPTPTATFIPTVTATPTVPAAIRTLERQMAEALNAERRARGLEPYEVDPLLRRVARQHSQDMVERGYFSHVTPEGVTLRERLERAGLTPYWAGENIQRNSGTGEEAVNHAIEWFMGSTPHRKNILHEHYTHIGVGVALEEASSGTFALTTFTLVFAELAQSTDG